MSIKLIKSVCYLSNDFTKTKHLFFDHILVAPEALLNGAQIQQWVADLRSSPKLFATNSLYLLREVYLQGIPCTYVNILDGVIQPAVESIDDITNLEILDRELSQADRYVDHNNKVAG